MAAGGFSPDRPEDPIWFVGATPVDERVAVKLDRPRREDIQIWSFLYSLSTSGNPPAHPVVVEPGDDPPDRVVRSPSGNWGCELTELTVEMLRAELAPVRQFGRKLKEALDADGSRYGHLRGRQIGIAFMPPAGTESRPGDADLIKVEEALREDKGCVGEGMQFSAPPTFPARLPDSGMYGQIGDFVVLVHAGGPPDSITVAGSMSASIACSDALALLRSRVADKDLGGTDVLLITCGLPDGSGYVCPLDSWLFQHLSEEANHGRQLLDVPPKHLRGVALPTGELARGSMYLAVRVTLRGTAPRGQPDHRAHFCVLSLTAKRARRFRRTR
jgi:hypothetical protein